MSIDRCDQLVAVVAFDPTPMLARIGADMQLYGDLVQMFHEDVPLLLGDIRAALASHDQEKLTLAAHTLCGAIGNFTVSSPYDLAKQLERQARSNDLDNALNTIDALSGGLDQLGAALTRSVSKAGS